MFLHNKGLFDKYWGSTLNISIARVSNILHKLSLSSYISDKVLGPDLTIYNPVYTDEGCYCLSIWKKILKNIWNFGYFTRIYTTRAPGPY